jgi:Fur family ferric uptake transcriptional regulator
MARTDEVRRRSTKQRAAILEAMMRRREFLSAQQLHQSIEASGVVIGLSTVYRTLTAMSELGDVDVIVREDGESLYRACSDAHHHHLVCRECGTTVEIAAEAIESWAAEIAAKSHFSDISHVVELFGICKTCRK